MLNPQAPSLKRGEIHYDIWGAGVVSINMDPMFRSIQNCDSAEGQSRSMMSNESCYSLSYTGKVKNVMEGGVRASRVASRYHLPSIRGALLALGRGQIVELQNVLLGEVFRGLEELKGSSFSPFCQRSPLDTHVCHRCSVTRGQATSYNSY